MASRRQERRGALAKILGFSAWVVLVALFLLWQATSYAGLMSLVGEWQFNAIGRQYPTFNYVFLVFLLCLPGYLIFLRPRRRGSNELVQAATLRSARALSTILFAAAGGLAAAALVVLIAMLFLPRDSGPRQQINLVRSTAVAPIEGPATITGAVIYERTAGLDENLLLASRNFRFVPVVSPRQSPGELTFFIELAPDDDRARNGGATISGVLQRDGLPGEIVRLFRYAGYQVQEPNWVLFTDPAAMRWPYLTLMAQFVIASLCALGFGLVQRRRVQRIDRDIQRVVQSGTGERAPAGG
jgi:hypothetical protein